MARLRSEVVKLIKSWIGKKESDGSYKAIIDIYNTLSIFPRGTKMQYSWPWCACTWSAVAIKLGYTDIMPIEISCAELIKKAKDMGCWQENDAYIPSLGDGVLYDWEDSGSGDNIGAPDHIGIVTYVNRESGYMEVTEGNYSDSVKTRTIALNGRYIRGFITPKYDKEPVVNSPVSTSAAKKDNNTIALEIIAGKWDSGNARKNAVTSAGYNYSEVQKIVNQKLNGSAITAKQPTQNQNQPTAKKVTATCAAKKFNSSLNGAYVTIANLYCRNDAGTNKKALCLIPAGTTVNCYGYYNEANGSRWPYIQFTMDGVQYTGFSSINYLKKK